MTSPSPKLPSWNFSIIYSTTIHSYQKKKISSVGIGPVTLKEIRTLYWELSGQ